MVFVEYHVGRRAQSRPNQQSMLRSPFAVSGQVQHLRTTIPVPLTMCRFLCRFFLFSDVVACTPVVACEKSVNELPRKLCVWNGRKRDAIEARSQLRHGPTQEKCSPNPKIVHARKRRCNRRLAESSL